MSTTRVLAVDDNAMNIAITEVALLEEKFEVETTARSVRAILKAALF